MACTLPLESATKYYTLSRSFPAASLSSLEFAAFCLAAPLSVASGLGGMYLFRQQKGLWESPAALVMWQMLAQFVVDLTWMAPGLHYVIYGEVRDNVACRVSGTVSLYCIFVSSGYSISLAIEVFYKIHRPLSVGIRTRAFWYHSLTHVMALGIALSASATSSVGMTAMHSCFYKPNLLDENVWVT
jgi:hypothetical protein